MKKLIRDCELADLNLMKTSKKDILINGSIIEKIENEIRIEKSYEVFDAKGMLCIPGFIDAHTHMVQSLQKGSLDDLCITDWLIKMLSTQAILTEEEWYYGVLIGLLQSIRFGVTTVNEMTYFQSIDAVAQAYNDSKMRVTFGLGATDIAENDNTPVMTIKDALDQAEYIYKKYHNSNNGLLRTSVAPQGLPACTKELMQALKGFSKERDLVFHTHLAEGKKETDFIKHLTGFGEGEALYEYGLLDKSSVLAHSIWLEDYELEMIKESGATIAHCPSTNMKISDGIPKIAKMIEKGIPIAIGCDGEASSSNRDVIREIRAGSYLQKAITLNPQVTDVKECYKIITSNGAKALGYNNLGEIKIGNLADILLIDTNDVSLINSNNRLSNLIYAGTGYSVDTVIVNGTIVLKNKKYTFFDQEEIISKGQNIIKDIYKRI